MKEKRDDTVITTRLQKFASAFIIQAPCIICKDKLVKVGDTYDLVDFLDNGGLNVTCCKFHECIYERL